MHNVLNIAKHVKTVAVRLRLIFQFTYVLYCSIKELPSSLFSFLEAVDLHVHAKTTINMQTPEIP